MKNKYKKVEKLFSSKPTKNQIKWGKIQQVWHDILTEFEKEGILTESITPEIYDIINKHFKKLL